MKLLLLIFLFSIGLQVTAQKSNYRRISTEKRYKPSFNKFLEEHYVSSTDSARFESSLYVMKGTRNRKFIHKK